MIMSSLGVLVYLFEPPAQPRRNAGIAAGIAAAIARGATFAALPYGCVYRPSYGQ
jgi:hypothetical protein